MTSMLDVRRAAEAEAQAIFIISLVLIGLGVWRALEGEWIPASVLIGFGGLKMT
jgi:hypothetical protein